MSPKNDDNDDDDVDRQNTYDEQQPQESFYRSSSPPVPTLKNKDKKQKSNVRRSPIDDTNQQPSLDNDNDELTQPPIDDNDRQSQQNYRKPLTPKQTGLINNSKKLSVAISCLLMLIICRDTINTKETTT